MERPQSLAEGLDMANRSRDWLNQAVRDLEQAEDSRRAARHEWACFAAQQAAEKAVKALHLYLGQQAWGHVIARLLRELPATISLPDGLEDKARILDNFYVATRYANGHPEGAPFEHYGTLHSQQALQYAGEILEFVRAQMA
jgi:HEPN domain-containing protein